ncbi:MAG: hypothetical protein WBA28_04970 [Microbacteriaceae bacterium]
MSTPISLDEAKKLAKRDDPETSHQAAQALDEHRMSATQKAIIHILKTDGPQAGFQITAKYFRQMNLYGWPLCDPYSVKRRISDLKRKKQIIDTGLKITGEYGNQVILWGLPEHEEMQAAA